MLAANIDYINDSITDCQATIVQLEETKVPTGPGLAAGEEAGGTRGVGGSFGDRGSLPLCLRRSWTPRTHPWSSAPVPWPKPASCWTTSSRHPSTRWASCSPPGGGGGAWEL